jgi:LPXTG-motif cell wall-anchored protein
MKQKLLLILALLVAISIAMPFAASAEEETGSIVLTTVPLNSFDGQTLNAYQIFHIMGNAQTGWTYMIHEDFEGFDYDGLRGLELIDYIYSLEDEAAEHGSEVRDLMEELMEYIWDNNIERTGFADIPAKVEIFSGSRLDGDDWIHYTACPNVTEAAITDLPLGYYLITGHALVTEHEWNWGWHSAFRTPAPFRGLASTNNEAHPLSISPKVSFPRFQKSRHFTEIGETSYRGVGQAVTFSIEAFIPSNAGLFDTYVFNIHATLNRPGDFVSSNTESKVLDLDIGSITAHLLHPCPDTRDMFLIEPLIEGRDYTIHAKGETSFKDTNDYVQFHDVIIPDFTVRLTQEFIAQNVGNGVMIRYSATINDAFGTSGNNSLDGSNPFNVTHSQNMAFLQFSDNPYDPSSYSTMRTSSWFAAPFINIFKFAGDINGRHHAFDGDSGVMFALSGDGGLQVGSDIDEGGLLVFTVNRREVVRWRNGSWATIQERHYVIAQDQEAPLSETRVKHLVPDDNGIVTVLGLPLGTYYLYETAAPDGYSQLAAPQQVTLVEETIEYDAMPGTFQVTVAVDPTAAVRMENSHGHISDWNVVAIQNNRSSMFPETGGIGTGIFLIIGSAIMTASGIALIIRKRISGRKKCVGI